ncbi:MAG: hypothetical protein HY362_02235 [Candidatus Aenigmarchaeota archaeon]|nr:hypothetical protein [Candidatus Aenigmarchaeota archaeon]
MCPNAACKADLTLQRERTKQYEDGNVSPKAIEHGKLISDKLKRRALELVIFLIGGVVAIIFGYALIGIGVIIFAFVILLPDENDVIQQKPRGKICSYCNADNEEMAKHCHDCGTLIPPDTLVTTKMTLGSEHLGFLYLRGFMKLLAASFIGWGTYYIHPILSIVVFFITYFSLPGSYEVTEPYKAIQSWARMFFGFVMAILILIVFSGGTLGNNLILIPIAILIVFALSAITTLTKNGYVGIVSIVVIVLLFVIFGFVKDANPSLSLFFLTTAFYVVMPTRNIERDKDGKVIAPLKITINFVGGKSIHDALNDEDVHNNWKIAGSIMFVGFASFGALPVVSSLLSGTGTVQIALGIVMLFSIIVGAISDRSARPYIGIIVMVFAILAFTFAQTGTVGNAVFGDYWPQVYAAMSVVANPISDIISDTSCQTNELFYCAANPVLCEVHKKQNPCGKAQKKEGSDKALTAKMNIIQAATTIDPTQPLVGSLQLKNEGDFPIRRVGINLENIIAIDPIKTSIKSGTAGAENKLDGVVGNFTSCGGGKLFKKDGNGGCTWELPFQKGETRILNFRFESSDKTLGRELNTCVCLKGDTEPVTIGTETKKKVKPDTIKPIGSEGACKDVLENKNFPGTNEQCTILRDDFGLEYRAIGYKMGGWLVRAKATYGFDYFANASLPITVVSPSDREQLILDKKLTAAELKPDSKYSGGPVGIDMNIAQQPVGYGEETLVTVNVRNNFKEKTGKITDGKLYIFIPTLGFEGVAYTEVRTDKAELKSASSPSSLKAGNIELVYNLKDLDSGQIGQVVLQIRYPEGTNIKKDLITANLDYQFENTITGAELALERAPAQ